MFFKQGVAHYLNLVHRMMEENDVLARPLFRILYGIVAILFVAIVFFKVVRALEHGILCSWGPLTWCIFIGTKFIILCFAYFAFIIAISGKPPKYFEKLKNRLRRNIGHTNIHNDKELKGHAPQEVNQLHREMPSC